MEFVIHQGDYTSIQNWIKTGAVDFGFVNPKAVNGLQTITLKEGIMPAVFPENHVLAKQDTVSLSDIANEPFILLEEGHYYEPLEAFQLIGKSPNIKYTIPVFWSLAFMGRHLYLFVFRPTRIKIG